MGLLPRVLLALIISAPGEAPPEASAPSTLRWFNRDVVTLRAPLLGLPPAHRAEAAALRLQALSAEGDGAVSLERVELGFAVKLDGKLVFFVQPGDVDPESGVTLEQAAQDAAAHLQRAVEDSRLQRRSESLSRAVVELALGTLVFALVVALVGWLRRRALKLLEAFVQGRPERVTLGRLRLVSWSTVALVLSWTVRLLTSAVQLVLLVQWVAFGLSRFPYSRPWGEQLQGFLLSTAQQLVLGIARAVPDLAVVLAIAWLTWAAVRLAGAVFRQVEQGHWFTDWLYPDTAVVTRKLVSFALVLFGIVMAYPYFPGSDTEAFKGLSVLLGLMVSLGGSSTVGQAAAGLILIYTRAFRVGDQVRVGEVSGRVELVGMFTTRLRSGQGEVLVVPNATIFGAATRNFTQPDRSLVVEVGVTVGYDESWRRVQGLLLDAAARLPGLRREPAPRVLVTSLADFYVSYQLVVSAPTELVREHVLTDLYRHVLDVFNEAGVQIMSPHYMADPETPKLAEGRPAA